MNQSNYYYQVQVSFDRPCSVREIFTEFTVYLFVFNSRKLKKDVYASGEKIITQGKIGLGMGYRPNIFMAS